MLLRVGGHRRRLSFCLWSLALVFLVSVSHVFAADNVWQGSTSTVFGDKHNWSLNALPGSTDNAEFNSTFTNQPSLGSTAATLGGLWMTTGVGQNVTISGTAVLTLSGNTINGTTNLGIRVDNTSAWTLTISAPLALGATQSWTNNSGNLLTVGAVNLSSFGLTVNGPGSTSVTGIVSGGGTFTKSGTGTLTLSGANTYSGLTAVTAGILNIRDAIALGTTAGATTVSSGATLQIQNSITVGNEGLTISGVGASGQNGALVSVSGTNNYGGLLALGAAATISSDSGTLNLTNAGTITGSGFGLTLTGSGNGSISSVIGTGTGTLTKSGGGTWTLTGTNSFTGSTTINAGTLTVAGSTGAALGATASITINTGGTLLLGASNQINNSAGMTLNGGTFATGGFSEGTASAVGIGALTLTASSHIDFGTGAVGVLSFASFSPGLNLLTIDNWTGTAATVGNAGTDRLIFDSDQTANLSHYTFTGYLGAQEIALGGGFFEIVPVFTPEPSTYFAAGLTLLATLYYQRRRIRCVLDKCVPNAANNNS